MLSFDSVSLGENLTQPSEYMIFLLSSYIAIRKLSTIKVDDQFSDIQTVPHELGIST